MPKVTVEQAQAILFGSGDTKFLAAKIEYYSNAWPANFAGLVDFQNAEKAFANLGPFNPLRQEWDKKVLEPILFCALRTWVCGNRLIDESALTRVSDSQWVFLFNGNHELVTRVNLAKHICKSRGIVIPPAWLRDLIFFVDYLDITDSQYSRGGAISNLFETIRTRLHELARIRFKAEFVTNSTLRTEDTVAGIMKISPDAVKKHRKAAEMALETHFRTSVTGEDIDFTPLDFILFQVKSEEFGTPR